MRSHHASAFSASCVLKKREAKKRTYAHFLRGDENELGLVGRFRRVDHHAHRDATIDGILFVVPCKRIDELISEWKPTSKTKRDEERLCGHTMKTSWIRKKYKGTQRER